MEGFKSSELVYFLEYIWLDVDGGLRSKTKVLYVDPDRALNLFTVPEWNFDGSSTGQSTTKHSDVILKPQATFSDPFRPDQRAYLILCDTKDHSIRSEFETLVKRHQSLEPLYGFEQEFFIIDTFTRSPIIHKSLVLQQMNCMSANGCEQSKKTVVLVKGSTSQKTYYCGVGANSVSHRYIINQILNNCLVAGVQVSGMNYEVAPGQCEIQVCDSGVRAADSLLILRYIIQRTFEPHGLVADFRTKPQGLRDPEGGPRFNASGCHTNFSTKEMRQKGNWNLFEALIEVLEDTHKMHMENYGSGNRERLVGTNETSSFEKFTWGVGDRAASVRIPIHVKEQGYGYIEDRRPSSSMNPYHVSHLLLKAYIDGLARLD